MESQSLPNQPRTKYECYDYSLISYCLLDYSTTRAFQVPCFLIFKNDDEIKKPQLMWHRQFNEINRRFFIADTSSIIFL